VVVALAGVGLAVKLGWSAYRLPVTGYRLPVTGAIASFEPVPMAVAN
jgi:hypothetical protein